MNVATRWMFDSPGRWLRVRLGACVALLAVTVALGTARCGGSPPAAAPGPAPTATSTSLEPAWSLSVEPVEPAVGPPDPIALEAVDAFLRHDVAAFGRVATPDATELMAASPTATCVLTGDLKVVHGGPTQQDLDVPTSLGTLRLQMVVRDGRWLVADLAFR